MKQMPYMKTTLVYIFMILSITTNAQSFTKFIYPDINNYTSDWRSVAPIDYDNDYNIDLIYGNAANYSNVTYRNLGDSTFEKLTNLIVTSQSSASGHSVWADYDNDCDLDAFWPASGLSSNLFFENNGDGSFTKITSGTVVTSIRSSAAAAWADVNSDGDIDLLVCDRFSGTNYLFINNNGTFTRIDTGVIANSTGSIWGCAFADIDNDNDPDLFLANTTGNNYLLINEGGLKFRHDTASIVSKEGFSSVSGTFGDYNNDGYLDLFVGRNQFVNDFLYTNNGNGTFTKVTTGAIVTDMLNTGTSSWEDFDNDGDLDLYLPHTGGSASKRNLIFINNGSGGFSKVTTGPVYQEYLSTEAAITADLNNDGWMDILNANRYAANTIFLNNQNNNNFFKCRLYGSASNRMAIGARVEIVTGTKKQIRYLGQQSGRSEHKGFELHFGLGQDSIIDSLIIKWPSSAVCTFTNVGANSVYNIGEASCVLDTVPTSSFSDSSSYLTAFFTNHSKGAISSFRWDFGDGDSSFLPNPSHRYTAPGKYEVTLSAYDNFCKRRIYKDSIEVCPDTSRLGFVDTHLALSLTFTDTSISSAYDYIWDFGDNSQPALGKVASHTYAQSGTYFVCITLIDSCRTKQFCDSITVCNDTIIAGFSYSSSKFTRTFNDTSTNASSVVWNFGDGQSSTTRNPTHTYAQSGTYYVCQSAIDACTSTTYCDSVQVCIDTLSNQFTHTVNGLTANFNYATANATSYQWYFGDGSSGTSQNPNHSYSNYGTYTVCLAVSNDCYSDSICNTVIICDPNLKASFLYTPNGFTYSFVNASTGSNSVIWDFGDGSSSSVNNPIHTYSTPGIYVVCQTIADACTTNTTCDTLRVCMDTTKAAYSFGNGGNSIIKFNNKSQFATSYLWDFGDGGFSTSANPSHYYSGFGKYYVCLIATGNCFSDTLCDTLHVCSDPGYANFKYTQSFNPMSIQFQSLSKNAQSYFWDFDNGTTSTNASAFVTYSFARIYHVCLTIQDSCGVYDTLCHDVNLVPFSNPDLEYLNAIEIYPNPTSGIIHIKNPGSHENATNISIVDASGKEIMRTSFSASDESPSLNISTYPAGVYLLKVKVGTESRNLRITKM